MKLSLALLLHSPVWMLTSLPQVRYLHVYACLWLWCNCVLNFYWHSYIELGEYWFSLSAFGTFTWHMSRVQWWRLLEMMRSGVSNMEKSTGKLNGDGQRQHLALLQPIFAGLAQSQLSFQVPSLIFRQWRMIGYHLLLHPYSLSVRNAKG